MSHPSTTHRAGRRLIAAAGTLTLAGTSLVGLGAAPALAAPATCGTFDRIDTNGGDLVAQNNAWGETSRQCIEARDGGFTVTEAQGDIPFGGAPKSYPSVLVGEHHGSGSDSDYLPVKVSEVAGDVRTSAKVTMAKGRYNVAYDWWVNSSPTSPGENDDTEIMVWTDQKGGPTPIGDKAGEVTIEGRTYDVWVGNIGWDVISFVDVNGTTSPDLALRPFLQEAIKRGVTGAESYLTSVQFGFEPWGGGKGLAVDDFTFGPPSERASRTTGEPAKDATVDPTLTTTTAPKPVRPDDGYASVAAGDDPALLITGAGQDDQQTTSDTKTKDEDDEGKEEGQEEGQDDDAQEDAEEDSAGRVVDLADPKREVTVHGEMGTATTPDGSPAAVLTGDGAYLEVEDSPELSIATTGKLTVELLMRPDVVKDMPGAEPSGDGAMVQPLVKGSAFGDDGDQEWAMRVYDQEANRPGRTSAYAFDPEGGQGAGSYAQDDLDAGVWTHLAAVFDTTAGEDGTVTFYRDGVATDSDTLGGDYDITPADGASPLFIGGDPNRSTFAGAIGAVAITPTALSEDQVAAHAGAALEPADDQDDTHRSQDEESSKDNDQDGESKDQDGDQDGGGGGEAAGSDNGRPQSGERTIPAPRQPAAKSTS